jgi:hypothetical protein
MTWKVLDCYNLIDQIYLIAAQVNVGFDKKPIIFELWASNKDNSYRYLPFSKEDWS